MANEARTRRGDRSGGALVNRPGSLQRALAYRNDQIVFRFMETYGVTLRDARELFLEAKRWIWLMARSEACGGPTLIIDDRLIMIDEMWHTFILFSKEYHRYCETHFGHYVHHAPTTRRQVERTRALRRKDPAGFLQRAERRLRRQYTFIYDQLGRDTLLRWYEELPRKIPSPRVKRRASREGAQATH